MHWSFLESYLYSILASYIMFQKRAFHMKLIIPVGILTGDSTLVGPLIAIYLALNTRHLPLYIYLAQVPNSIKSLGFP